MPVPRTTNRAAGRSIELKRLLTRFSDFLYARGLKLTPAREAVFVAMFNHAGPESGGRGAEEVSSLAKGISISSVYRTIELLCLCGIVARTEGPGARFAVISIGPPRTDRMTCRVCGAEITLDPAIFDAIEATLARVYGFSAETRETDFVGVCVNCSIPGA